MKIEGRKKSQNVVYADEPYGAIVKRWMNGSPDFYGELFEGRSEKEITGEVAEAVSRAERTMGRQYKGSEELIDILKIWMYEKVKNRGSAHKWMVDEDAMLEQAEAARKKLGFKHSKIESKNKENAMMYEDDDEEKESPFNQSSRYKADAAKEHMRALGKAEESMSNEEYKEKKESAHKNLLQSRIISLSHTFVKVFPGRFKTADDAQDEIEDRLAKGESIHQIASEIHNDPEKIEESKDKWEGVLSGESLRDKMSEREKLRRAAEAAE